MPVPARKVIIIIIYTFIFLAGRGVYALQPPNILLIIADDLGVDISECYKRQSDYPLMPNLKKICQKALIFDQAWSYPTCSPTRAAIMTGRFAFRTGVGAPSGRGNPGIKLTENTIPKILDQKLNKQYSNAVIGKWHLSDNNNGGDYNPGLMGWQYYSGLIRGALKDYYSWPQVTNGKTETVNEYATSHFVNEAISWVKQQNNKPWLLWLAFTAPHSPFHLPPPELVGKNNLPDNKRSIRQNPTPYHNLMVEALDKEVGRLLASIGSLDNTYIIFIGDNGTAGRVSPIYDRNKAKGTLYQGGIHIPLIISGPEINQTYRIAAPVMVTDLFATILEIAGVKNASENTDSVSLTPYFKNPSKALRKWVYSEQFGSLANNQKAGQTISDGRYKLIKFDDGQLEFYDLFEDPLEEKNLINQLSEEEQQSLKKLQEILNSFKQ